MYRLLLLVLLLPLSGFSQFNKDYQGLLWKISGNGLEEPSYLYGTMHVSNRVAFHLGETFFDALESAEYVALETSPETWVKELEQSSLHNDYYEASSRYSHRGHPLYKSFIPEEPQQQDWEYYLSRDLDILNSLLYRINPYEQEFAENTYLDLFIYQAGKKAGVQIVSLEDYEESFKQVLLSGKRDEDAVYLTDRQSKEFLGDFNDYNTLMEDAYRRGDLDLIDTLNSVLSPGKYHRHYMLNERNEIMVRGMDSLMQLGTLFTGVGAAHLPGDNGVINLLRELGYTVEAEDRVVATTGNERKEEIDDIIYVSESRPFLSDDGFVSAAVPGEMTKLLGQPFQEYVYADMANGAFYSLRRISTFGAIYNKSEEFYYGKLDSMLFENIPGKILSKERIKVDGYPGLDIVNETRSGDHQHYQIVFTPLEVLIFKVGGNKEFAISNQPEEFFKSIKLNAAPADMMYSPSFSGFTVALPGSLRTEMYEGTFENPHVTFWAQSYNEGDYYAAGLRQYHDFEYIEEDDFELEYFAVKWAEDKDLDVDTVYLVKEEAGEHSRFELSNSKGVKVYGEVHIQGPKYVMLITTSDDESKRLEFFSSFTFSPWEYQNEFKEYRDSVFHITMETPMDVNNYESFFKGLSGGGYYGNDDEDHSYKGEEIVKMLTYTPSGEQVLIKMETLHIYKSVETLEEFWTEIEMEAMMELNGYFAEDSVLYTIEEDDYLSQAKLYTFTDSNSTRTIRTKMILENGALYSVSALGDSKGYQSEFADAALRSFRPAADTVIGTPLTLSKADMFFEALDSRDSVSVFEAKNSVYVVQMEDDDAERVEDYVLNYSQEGFDRSARFGLMYKLVGMEKNQIEFFEDLYYQKIDSSAFQFEILEDLIDLETEEGVASFTKLLMDEPPFTSNTYSYTSLFNHFNDSLELAPAIFPEVLPLADFEDYRSTIYGMMARLLDSNMIEGKDYQSKYETLLLFAKVALKKQHAADEVKGPYSRPATSNATLLYYTKLLTPFSVKKEVQEHFEKLLSIRNKQVLADMLMAIEPYANFPDSSWNYVASEPKALYKIYPYLAEEEKLDLLDDKYKMGDEFAKSILLKSVYRTYDTISFIQVEDIELKSFPAKVYFFRAQNDDDRLWKLLYVVLEDKEEVDVDYVLAQESETYNESVDDLDEIIEDTLKEIELNGRERVVEEYGYGMW